MDYVLHRAAGLLGIVCAIASPAMAEPNWPALDSAMGASGKVLGGEVHRYGFPRTDLRVTIHEVKVEPALALGSWASFVSASAGDTVLAMGDLVLLDAEVNPVVSTLGKHGIEVTAIHNHLLHESPHVTYVHFMAHGDATTIAQGLRAALATTKTPAPPGAKIQPGAAELAAFKELQEALGLSGALSGRVLQIGVPRAEKIEDHGVEIPPSMGISNSMNFQLVGDRLATTGDLVLIASEVNPVLRELQAHGFEVTAVHSHMLTETPRLFFMHFWGFDSPRKVGEALQAALSKILTKAAH